MIEINALSLKINEKTILDDLKLDIKEGSIFGFLGPNGAGKSTLMRCICGVYKPTSGCIKIDGEDVFDNARAKGKIFFVNDETIQYTSMTLTELKNYYKNYYVDFDEATFEKLLSRVNLPRDSKLGSYSKGMKRQAIVIIALACKTPYLILDEAFDGLDPAMRMAVKSMITDEIIDRGATVIVSSHNITEISEICDSAMLIHEGKILFSDEIDDITSRFSKLQIVFRGNAPDEEAIRAAGLEALMITVTGSVVQIVANAGEQEAKERAWTLGPEIVEAVPLTLEEIFIYEMEARGYAGFFSEGNA